MSLLRQRGWWLLADIVVGLVFAVIFMNGLAALVSGGCR